MSIFRNLIATEFLQIKLHKVLEKRQFNNLPSSAFNYMSMNLQKKNFELQLK